MKQAKRSPSSNHARAALSSEDLCGVFLPLPTPFDSVGDLDLRALQSNINKWNDTGINGFVMLGSTGERVHLEEREYLEVITTAREQMPAGDEGRTFIVGAGQQSTRGTINEIRRVASSVPVDAYLVITPYFYKPSITQEALVAHYQSVADESPAPVILYSMPALTGIKIEPETAARLSEHENIIGIKDSSADISGLAETIKLVSKDFAVLTGNGTVLREALTAGAIGGILAVGCVAPTLCIAIFRAVMSGDIETAARLQSSLTPLAQAVTTRFGIGGLKAALDLQGYVGGAVRMPLRGPDAQARQEIQRYLEIAEAELGRLQSSETATVV
jgi:4-hydroxy-2-oxoglutarate aldolase